MIPPFPTISWQTRLPNTISFDRPFPVNFWHGHSTGMMAATAPTPYRCSLTVWQERRHAAVSTPPMVPNPCCSLGEADVNHIDAKAQGPSFTIQRAGVPQGLSLGDLAQDQWQR